MNKYLPTIGLEIHAELKTRSKMFCSCKNDPDEQKPNVNICPICLGHPGTLPVLNHEAIRHVLRVGTALGGKLADFTEWDRKNYFYPDIPKGYQISQYKYPLVEGGMLAGVELERVHLEEDTAQSTHDSGLTRSDLVNRAVSLINFNRAGVPLMELVTKPVIHDAATAVRFAKELQLLLRYLGAGDANMEKGEMRVEANISVAPITQAQSEEANTVIVGALGTKTEVKNLNSFRAVEKAIEYEIERQTSLLENGEQVAQETRGWDDGKGETFSQRSKESSHDYRYFPDPDIPKMKLSEIPEFSADTLRKDLPELPWAKRDRYKTLFSMTDKEAAVFVESPELAEYFQAVITPFKDDPKLVKLSINYILSDYLGLLKGQSVDVASRINTIGADSFSEVIKMTAKGEISSRGAKDLIAILVGGETSPTLNHDSPGGETSPRVLAEKHGLLQQSNAADIEPAILEVIKTNASVVAEYKSGKTASLQFLIGQAMKATKGAANPTVVKELLIKKLGNHL